MEKIFLVVLLLMEVGFFVWSLVKKNWGRKEKTIGRGMVGFVMIVLLIVGVLYGIFRYLPLLILLAVQTLINVIILVKRKNKKYSIGKGVLLLIGNAVLYIVCFVPALVFPQFKPIPVTGTHEVMVKEFTWEDTSRKETFSNDSENRKITVKFWYPKEQGNYPLAVFSHGAFGVIDSNNSTCTNLASNGYVVASIGYTYQAMYVKDTSGKITLASQDFLNEVTEMNGSDDSENEKKTYIKSKKWMALRSADANFVLNTILKRVADAKASTTQGEDDTQLWNKVNPNKIGLFGHSMGGATSVEVGRQRKDISAVIDIEGTMFGEYTGFNSSTGMETYRDDPYKIPILDVNSRDIYEQEKDVPGQGYVNSYLGKRATNYKSVIFEKAEHLNFTDLAVISPFLAGQLGIGEVDSRKCIENVNDMVLQFFNRYLKGDRSAVVKDIY